MPATATDVVGEIQYLSTDPTDRNFLRVPADSPLATQGAGHGQPTYIGALPPGPAPPNGDWFTRLLDRLKDPPSK